MAALRSRRLERLLGARLDAISHVQVVDHVTNAVTEAYDLDFKGELYGNADNGPAISQGALEATRRAAVELLERGTHSEGGRRDRIQRDQWGVNPMTAVAVYDAYGHTARFVVADLRGRGFTPVLCGRDTQRLRALAAEHPGAQIRHACPTRQPVSLDRALAGDAAVVNCSGPFGDTCRPWSTRRCGCPSTTSTSPGRRWSYCARSPTTSRRPTR